MSHPGPQRCPYCDMLAADEDECHACGAPMEVTNED